MKAYTNEFNKIGFVFFEWAQKISKENAPEAYVLQFQFEVNLFWDQQKTAFLHVAKGKEIYFEINNRLKYLSVRDTV